MKVGVVGTGFGARVVAPVFAATAGCDVVDVVSARDDGAVDALIGRADVDLVSIHSPPFLHARHVYAALARGKAVLCDKPFAMSVAEATALLAAAETAGVAHLVNFEFRFHPVRRRVRDLVQRGAVGEIEHVVWTHLSAGSRIPLRPYGWLFDRARGGGWIGAWGSHAVDTLRFMFGEVTDAIGFPRTAIAERPDADGHLRRCTAEDGLQAQLVVGNGITVAIDSGFAAGANLPARFVVSGREGVLEVVGDERMTLRRPDGAREDVTVEGDGSPRSAGRHDDAMRRFAEVVRDVVDDAGIQPDAPTFADGLACDEVLARLRGARA